MSNWFIIAVLFAIGLAILRKRDENDPLGFAVIALLAIPAWLFVIGIIMLVLGRL
jgi:hypothetical protein